MSSLGLLEEVFSVTHRDSWGTIWGAGQSTLGYGVGSKAADLCIVVTGGLTLRLRVS